MAAVTGDLPCFKVAGLSWTGGSHGQEDSSVDHESWEDIGLFTRGGQQRGSALLSRCSEELRISASVQQNEAGS